MIRKLQALKAKKGFTLVELMVVIAIIGVLAAILIPLMANFINNARISSANSAAASMRNNVTYFLSEHASRSLGVTGTGIITITVTRAGGTAAHTPAFGGTLAWINATHAGWRTEDLTGAAVTGGAQNVFVAYLNVVMPDSPATSEYRVFVTNNSGVSGIYYPTGSADVQGGTPGFNGTGGITGVFNGRAGGTSAGTIVGASPAPTELL